MMKKFFTLFLGGVACSMLTISSQAQTPFAAGTNVAIAKQGIYASPSKYLIYTSSTPGVPFQSVANVDLSSTDGKDINGIGLDPTDHFVYGSVFYGPESKNNAGNTNVWLYRIGSDGDTVNLGLLPTPGSTGDVLITALPFSGAVSTDHKYYYIVAGVTGQGLSKLISGVGLPLTLSDVHFYIGYVSNLTTLTSNTNAFGSGPSSLVQSPNEFYSLDVTSDPSVTLAFTQYIGQIKSSASSMTAANGGIQDIAISPANTSIYAYITYPDPNNSSKLVGRPVEFSKENATTVKVTSVGTQTTSVEKEADGCMFDALNNFYVLFTNGNIAQVDLGSGALNTPSSSGMGSNIRGDLAGYITNNALPVVIGKQLNAKLKGNDILLTWSTTSEINFDKFELQHSTDNKTWSHLDYVQSNSIGGNSSLPLDYKYEDQSPVVGNNYYKLIAIDLDGKSKQVGFTSIVYAGNANASTVYPNPAKDYIYITGITSASNAALYDMSGRLIKTQRLVGNGNKESISVQGIASGVYHLVITSSNSKKSFSVIVAR